MIYQRIISGAGMILVGFLFPLILKKRKNIAFSYILYGAVAWIITVLLKLAWALPVNKHLYSLLYSLLTAKIAGPIFWLYVGLLTGIFECGGIYLIIRFSKLKNMSLFESYGFGYGFGGIEAVLIGFTQFATIVAISIGKAKIPNMPWSMVPAPIVERVMTIFLHLFTTLLIIYAVKGKRLSLFWLSFLYKSLVDAIAAWSQLSFGVTTILHIWIVEGILFVVTLPSIIASVMFLRKPSHRFYTT